VWGLLGEPGREGGGSGTGDPEEYVKEDSGNGHLSSQGPSWATGLSH
jgi:hypothetical protein